LQAAYYLFTYLLIKEIQKQMSKADSSVIAMVIVLMIGFLLLWIAGLWQHRLLEYLTWLNLLTAAVIIIYWVEHEIRIKQHFPDLKEVSMLAFEISLAGISVYALLSNNVYTWIKIVQYTSFCLHSLALVLFLVFMLTFKITKLF